MGIRDEMISRLSRYSGASNPVTLKCTLEWAKTLIEGIEKFPDEEKCPSLPLAKSCPRFIILAATCQERDVYVQLFPCMCVSLRDRGKWQKAETGSRKCRRWLVTRFHHAFRAKTARTVSFTTFGSVGTIYVYVFECRHSCLLEACVRNDDGLPIWNIKQSFNKARPSRRCVSASIW